MLWHYCLGHPNFFYLKCLLTSPFINKNPPFSNVILVNYLSILEAIMHQKFINHLNLFLSFEGTFGDHQEFKISLGHIGFYF